MANKNQKTLNASAFGISAEAAEKIRTDILPACPIGQIEVGKTLHIKVLSGIPELVTHKQKDAKTKEEVEVQTPVLKVRNMESGMEETLWLSSTSLKQEMFKISSTVSVDLEGVEVLIKAEEYSHVSYGKVRGYRVQVLKDPHDGKETPMESA